MRYLYTADYHINHANIVRYVNRPFKSLEEMNETIIHNHNSRVKKEDIVFHVGDFIFRNSAGGKLGEGLPIKASEMESKFNGKFIFIKGNHDRNNSLKTGIERLVIKYAGKRINLVHDPEYADMNHEINFVGHVHNRWAFKRLHRGEAFTDLINVGVDVWGFKPVTFEEIYSKYCKWKKLEKLK